ncbi:MAG: hypothetical protein JKY94_13695 [Rhodobacteraceae bacterium]|nr:hypothetical protein [Paracoccaceae bacterium]
MNDVVLSWSGAQPGEQANDFSCGKISVNLSEFEAFTEDGNDLMSFENSSVSLEQRRWWWGLPFFGRDMNEKLGTIHKSVKNVYLKEIKRLSDAFKPAGEAISKVKISVNAKPEYGKDETLDFVPDLLRREGRVSQGNINTVIASTYQDITQSEYASSGGYDEMVKRGWGAAGLWYGTLGTINKKYMDAVASAVPTLDILFAAEEVSENQRGALGTLFRLSRYGVSGSATSEIEGAINLASRDFLAYIEEVRPEIDPLYQDVSDVSNNRSWYEEGHTRYLGNAMVWMLGGRQIQYM